MNRKNLTGFIVSLFLIGFAGTAIAAECGINSVRSGLSPAELAQLNHEEGKAK